MLLEQLQESINQYEKKCQVNALPVLYSPYCDVKTRKETTAIGQTLEWFANLELFHVTRDYLISPSSVEEELGIQKEIEQSQGSQLETGNLEDLNHALNQAIDDRNKIANPPLTDDMQMRQIFADDVDHFYAERITYHAQEITQIIQALLEYDQYPEHWFGKFQEIREKIFVEDDPKIANKMLGMLIRIGRSQLPKSVRTEESETIDSNSTSPNNVSGG